MFLEKEEIRTQRQAHAQGGCHVKTGVTVPQAKEPPKAQEAWTRAFPSVYAALLTPGSIFIRGFHPPSRQHLLSIYYVLEAGINDCRFTGC